MAFKPVFAHASCVFNVAGLASVKSVLQNFHNFPKVTTAVQSWI